MSKAKELIERLVNEQDPKLLKIAIRLGGAWNGSEEAFEFRDRKQAIRFADKLDAIGMEADEDYYVDDRLVRIY